MPNVYPEKYTQYARDVISGKIVAGYYIKLAAKRYLDFMQRDDMEFRTKMADKPVNFISKLLHTEGQFYKKPFILQDWQAFMVYAMFGFYWKGTDKRVCRNAYIQISRKCGKTSLASALALYGLIGDGEAGAEIDFVAPSAEQTRIGFRAASNYAESINRANILNCLRNTITFNPTKGRIRMMSSDAKLGDGFNPHFAIIDEYHALETNDLPNVMMSGMGMRRNPMMIYITTAGFNVYGPCKEYRDMCADILEGEKVDDTIFALIYELDRDDDWIDETKWKKCIPSLNITVEEDYIKQQVTLAKNNVSMEVGVRTKNLNQWVESSQVWISDEIIRANMKPVPMEAFNGQIISAGIDLAAVSDLTVYSIMMSPNPDREFEPDKYVFKSFYYLPSECLENNRNWQKYRLWQQHKYLTVNPGNVTDYRYILDDIKGSMDKFMFNGIYYDAWQSTLFIIMATEEGLPCVPYSQSIGNFTKPVKTFELLLKKGDIVIDDNPITRWCFQNVVLKEDHNQNCKPTKDNRDSKIDVVISMLEALGGWLADGNGDVEIV
jgi:phage terminase large subunit-like protein